MPKISNSDAHNIQAENSSKLDEAGKDGPAPTGPGATPTPSAKSEQVDQHGANPNPMTTDARRLLARDSGGSLWCPPNGENQTPPDVQKSPPGASGKPDGRHSQAVSVDGNRFTLNGKPWTPKAVVLRAFEAPNAYTKVHDPVQYKATLAYGPKELQAIHKYGANTIRFLVSQPSLDPKSKKYSPSYVAQLTKAVKEARAHHFVVDLAMQDENGPGGGSGSKRFFPLANDSTVRAWTVLNKRFGKDQGVMFELYNEPGLAATSRDWGLWAHGGRVPAEGADPAFNAVGMQTLVDKLRKEGSVNTFLLDGLHSAHSLDGLPQIRDPLHRVGYAVHPYFAGHVSTAKQWEADFGAASKKVPVFANEFSAGSGDSSNVAGGGGTVGLGTKIRTFQPVVKLLNFLRKHNIGVAAGGFDVPGFVRQSVPGGPLTNYDNYNPHKSGDGAGALIHEDFISNYKKNLTLADGLSQGPEKSAVPLTASKPVATK